MEFGPLDELLLRMTKELEVKEKELEVLISEVQKLKNQARTLEDARVLLVEQRSAAYAYVAKTRIGATVSLQDEIVKCLDAIHDGGLAVVEVVKELRLRKYPNSDSRIFYSSVFVTLARLEKRGAVIKFQGDDGRTLFKLNRGGVPSELSDELSVKE